MSMLARFAAPTLVLTLLACAPRAQGTTGVAGFNDYTIAGLIPGSASCQFLPPFPGFSVQTFTVSTAPGAAVALLFTGSPNCLCRECIFPFPPQTSCPPPLNPFCPATNQSLDLVPGCGLLSASLVADAAGIASIAIPLPPPGFAFGTQAVALHPCATLPFPFLLTQAYAVRTM